MALLSGRRRRERLSGNSQHRDRALERLAILATLGRCCGLGGLDDLRPRIVRLELLVASLTLRQESVEI